MKIIFRILSLTIGIALFSWGILGLGAELGIWGGGGNGGLILVAIGLIMAGGTVVWFSGKGIIRSRKDSLQTKEVANLKSAISKSNDTPPAHQENLVSKKPSGSGSSTSKKLTLFLSYRRQDSADVTGRIYDRLVNSFQREYVFKDVDSIPLGLDFRKHIDEKVGSCDVVVSVIGPNWVRGNSLETGINSEEDFVRIEIESALKRGIPIIPVLVRGASMPTKSELPESIAEVVYRNGIPVRPDPDFHRDMDRLIAGINEHLL